MSISLKTFKCCFTKGHVKINADCLRLFANVSQNYKNHFLKDIASLLKSPPENMGTKNEGKKQVSGTEFFTNKTLFIRFIKLNCIDNLVK